MQLSIVYTLERNEPQIVTHMNTAKAGAWVSPYTPQNVDAAIRHLERDMRRADSCGPRRTAAAIAREGRHLVSRCRASEVTGCRLGALRDYEPLMGEASNG
ncbi:hypothetical protein J2W46_005862 [Paraburkholderia strydomiana]|nr:hypothetical protein [Paraburkholderia strydomiana]